MGRVRHYRYVGPREIAAACAGLPSGCVIHRPRDAFQFLDRGHDTIVIYVVDRSGHLLLSGRHSEHVQCAGGEDVLAAGELTLSQTPDGASVLEITNQSTGYCPEPDCWPTVAHALERAGLEGPGGFTSTFMFRRCPACGQVNVVKEDDFACAVCRAELPRAWNLQS